jgi:hypothetical protein
MHDNFQKQIESKTDDQLLEIYLNSDEFQSAFVELAQKELQNRKIDLSGYEIRKQHRIAYYSELYEKGRPGNPVYIIFGFIFSLLGGILGIIGGYTYSQSKNKEFGDGSYYVYDTKTRNLGIGMMAIGIASMVIEVILFYTD